MSSVVVESICMCLVRHKYVLTYIHIHCKIDTYLRINFANTTQGARIGFDPQIYMNETNICTKVH